MTAAYAPSGSHASERPANERRFRQLVLVGATFLAVYFVLAAVNAATVTMLAFYVPMLPMPFMAWCAFVRASPALRRLWLLLAIAATLWSAGSFVWLAIYLASDGSVPEGPGLWDLFYIAAYASLIAGIVVSMRESVSIRGAFLDACVVGAAAIALGWAFVVHGFEAGIGARSIIAIGLPVLGILAAALILSAVLGDWHGLPRSTALVGLAQLPLTVGSLVWAAQAIQHEYTDTRWANVAWVTGAVASLLAISIILLRVDAPLYFTRDPQIPHSTAGIPLLLVVSAVALMVGIGVAYSGFSRGPQSVALIGVASCACIGTATAARAALAIGALRHAYERLDAATARIERRNDELLQVNASLQVAQLALRDFLRIKNEETGGALAALLADHEREFLDLDADD